MSENAEDRRSFEFFIEDEAKNFYLGMPTSEHIRKAEWHYSKVYNKALVEGVATTAEMMDILTKRGLYGPEYEAKLNKLQVGIAESIIEMQATEDEAEKERLARKVEDLRNELYRWNQRLTGPLSNSCEQMAEDAKTEYITSVVVQYEDGSLVWKDHESFVTERDNQGLALKSRFEVMLWLQGLDADFLERTPEQVVLQELALERAKQETEAAEQARLESVEKKQLKAPTAPKKKRAKKTAKAKKASK